MKTLKQHIRKADIILFFVLVITGIAVSAVLAVSRSGASAGSKVVIESGGRLFATYALSEDRTIAVPAPKQIMADDTAKDNGKGTSENSAIYDRYNIVEIHNGEVRVSEASCKNQVCVHHSAISRSGESIVCLPNRLLVRIDSDNSGEEEGEAYDTITS